jgi:hypothetical protein
MAAEEGESDERRRTSAPRSDGRGVIWALAALTLFALVLRLWQVGALLPYAHESDADMVTQAEMIHHGDPNPGANPNWASYPNAIARIANLFPLEPSSPPSTLDEHLAAAARPHLVVRRIVAVLSVLLVPAAFWLARLFYSARWSLVAAALVATSLLSINYSQQARPHAAAAGLTVLAVLGAVRLRRDPRPLNYAFAATAAALAFGILQFGAFAWPALLVAHVLRDRSQRRSALPGIAICVAALAASVLLFHGYLFDKAAEDRGAFMYREGELYFGTHLVLLDFSANGLYTLAHGLWSFDPVLFGLTAVGIVCLPFAARRWRALDRGGVWFDVLVLLAHVVPFLVGAGIFNRAYARFLIPLLPHCACLALLVLRLLSRLAQRCGVRGTLAGVSAASIGCAAAALALPTFIAVKWAYLRTATDSAEQLAAWIRATPERAEARYFTSLSVDLPLPRRLLQGPAGLRSTYRSHAYPWWRYQLGEPPGLRESGAYDLRWFSHDTGSQPLAPFANQIPPGGSAYVVIQVNKGGYQGEDHPLRRALARLGGLAVRFGPYDADQSYRHTLSYDPTAWDSSEEFFEWKSTYAGRVLAARRLGPILEVYRLTDADVSRAVSGG